MKKKNTPKKKKPKISTTKNSVEETLIEDIYESFLENIKSTEIFFNRLSPFAKTEDKAIEKEKADHFEKCLNEVLGEKKSIQETNKTKRVRITDAELDSLLEKLYLLPPIPAKNYTTLTKGAFIMLNNYFEYLFSDLLSYYFKKNSSALGGKKITLSLEELKKYSSINEAHEDLIYKEVESLLLELNFEELKSYFKEKLKIGLEEELINWSFINEIRERRHIIVHNNSIVNNKYLVRTNNPFSLRLNKEALIDNKYFLSAFNEIKVAGVLLCLNCWGNWDKDQTTDAIEEIMDISFQNLKQDNYDFVNKICMYTEKNIRSRNDDEDDCIYRIKFNHCIALKNLGQKDELAKKLSAIKIGALSPIFKIVHNILKDKDIDAVKLLDKAKAVGDLSLEQYQDWPIFKSIRANNELNKQAIEILT